ncbi:MAG: sigma-70 family RNA polymerase sigma factor [Solirubrobacterales bacterium]
MSEAATPGAVSSGAGPARVLSDDRLIRRAVGGDERAFAAIFDRYHQSLYRYCLAIVGDPQDAQDALQNTMVKVLRALPGEERELELRPWLYRIAHNESIELLRRRRETRPLDMELASPGAGLAENATARDRLRRLISDLDQLPERQRGALVMRELAGLDFAEIGAAFGTSPAVARQTLYEARLSLRQMDEGRAMSCATVTKLLSDGDGRVGRRRDVRAHLRTCTSCRRFREEIGGRERDLAALSPLPAVVASGLLHGLLGGHGAGGSGLAGALGGGAAKTLGTSAALKGAATVAVVAAIGVGAADRGGLVDVVPGGGSRAPRSEQSRIASPSAAEAARVSKTSSADEAGGLATGAKASALHAAKTRPATDSRNLSEGSSSLSHPHGRGHEKQHPSASTHGQQMAAAHKAGSREHAPKPTPAHPAKPSHPAHPSKPSPEKETPSTPSSVQKPAPEAAPQGSADKPAYAGKETASE